MAGKNSGINLVLQAADFAAGKHSNKRRKDSKRSPYINHPVRAALLMADAGCVTDNELLAAAFLHDTIEDTETTNRELAKIFGARIAGIVNEVSDDKSLPKKERKQRQILHAKELSKGAAVVKLCDLTSNILDLTDNPPARWNSQRCREYLDWAEKVISNLPPANKRLRRCFFRVLQNAREKIR